MEGVDLSPQGAQPESAQNTSERENTIPTDGQQESTFDEKPTPLHDLAINFNTKSIEISLAKHGKNVVNLLNNEGRTALHEMAIEFTCMKRYIQPTMEPQFMEILNMLISNGTDLNIADKRKETVLHSVASRSGHAQLIRTLIMSGAKFTAVDGGLQTALHKAVKVGDASNALSLLEFGGNQVNLGDNQGNTPLHLAVTNGIRQNGELMKVLLDNGAKTHVLDKNQRTALHLASRTTNAWNLQSLLDGGADANAGDSCGNTPLHIAATYDITGQNLARLLASSPIVDMQNKLYNETPLHKAVQLNIIENIKILIRYRANPNRQNAMGESCLHVASKCKDVSVWLMLMNAGGDPELEDDNHLTPRSKAMKAKNNAAIAVMRQFEKDE